ncbi:hypothetical protein B0H66DRAFT_553084 [Apodospora peruviana]|uniref:FAD/NAD(P)-binding domain-containing protein n=1 Tax=Apodospora peruviana TaxID=516989 RepID=A0AAE0IBK4_9PEZI|nr:hypothetical protein B0H66DRAFT_553084 [Apodospora peruviana]
MTVSQVPQAYSDADKFDVVVIGTGLGGLTNAKTYLEIAPQTNLCILEANATLGGVWAQDKLYPGLKTNNLRGSYEWTDFPMTFEEFPGKPVDHVSGYMLHDYFTAFAKHFDLLRRIRFNTKVETAEKVEGGWLLTCPTGDPETGATTTIKKVFCTKLVVATGLSNRIRKMHIPGEENFTPPLYDHVSFATEGQHLATDPSIQRITVFGGSKTSYDFVHLFASQGKKVDWVIRRSGHGPQWMGASYCNMFGGRFMTERLATVRAMTMMSPCIWGEWDGFTKLRGFLHGTWLGRAIVGKFWSDMSKSIVEQSGLMADERTQKLIPDCEAVWSNFSILNYPTNIYDYVSSGLVTVHRKDVSHLSGNQVHLEDGTIFQSDGMIKMTGWEFNPSIKYLPEGIDSELGIASLDYSVEQRKFWDNLDAEVDREIFSNFKMLKSSPTAIDKTSLLVDPLAPTEDAATKPSFTPYRLYRSIAPPGLTASGDRSVVFVKHIASISNYIVVEVQSLWSYAYLNNLIEPSIDPKTVHYQSARTSRWFKHRYPYGFGARYPDIMFDSIPYVDMLLTDLGLPKYRKGSWYKELTDPYLARDYKGITQEWLAKRQLEQLKG